MRPASFPYSVSLALLILFAVVATACTANETVTISDAAISSATATAPRPTIAPPAPTAIERVEGAQPACRYVGVDTFGDMQLEVSLTASLSDRDDADLPYVVQVDGKEIATGSEFIEDVAPGEVLRLQVDTLEREPEGLDPAAVTCSIGQLDPYDFGDPPFRPASGDMCRFVEIDDFDDIQLELTITNPLSAAGELAIDYAVRGADDVRFEDGVFFTEVLDPGEVANLPVDTVTELPNWVTEADVSCDILAIEEFG